MKSLIMSLILLVSASSFADELACDNMELTSIFEDSQIKGDLLMNFKTSDEGKNVAEFELVGVKSNSEGTEKYNLSNSNCTVDIHKRVYKNNSTSKIREVKCYKKDSSLILGLTLKELNMRANVFLNEDDYSYNSASSSRKKLRCSFVD